MALTTYTSYDEIRAILGVSATELPDSILSLSIYDMHTVLALEDIYIDLPYDFSVVSALPTKSANQQRFLDLTKLYAPYAIAKELLTSLPMFSVKQLTDGRAGFMRQDDVQQQLKENIDGALLSLKYRLGAIYTTLYPTKITVVGNNKLTLTKISVLGTDPVTG
jgi:hypothetical protein